jgi:hypothetical protein
MTELKAISNMPKQIKIGDKQYPVKSPCIGVASLIGDEMKIILEALDFHPEQYDPKTTQLTDMVGDMVKGIYTAVMNNHAQITDSACNIIALLINNKPLHSEDLAVTPEHIKWNADFPELIKLLVDVIRMGDLTDFLLLMTKAAQGLDVEGTLSNSQNSSTPSHNQPDGPSST